MENQHYNHLSYNNLNYNDNTTTISSSNSSTTSTTKEETEKHLLQPETVELIKYFRALYYDAIGSYPATLVCKMVVQDLENKVYSMENLEYALRETAFAPRPSWAYTAAILRRLKMTDGLPF